MEKFNVLITYVMLLIFIPGLPFMMLVALQNNPNRWLSNWIQAHRKLVLMGYMISNISFLLIATAWLTTSEIWAFLKIFMVPALLLTGVVLYPYVGQSKKI